MKNNSLLDRYLEFAVRIVNLTNLLPKTPAGYAIASQIVRSGTSVGANAQEAKDAVSHNDFLNKISISLKEARETNYWLKVIFNANLINGEILLRELKESEEIISILVRSVKTTKERYVK